MLEAPSCQAEQIEIDRRWYAVWFLIGVLLGICVIKIWPLPEEEVRLRHDIFYAEEQMSSIQASLIVFRSSQRDLPTSEEGLAALVDPPSRFKFQKSFIKSDGIHDPWGTPFGYARIEQNSYPGYDLWSAGPDKVHFTDDDIIRRYRW